MADRSSHTILIKRSAEKEMDRLPEKVFERVAKTILALESNPRPRGCAKLRGVEEYRLRVGSYRILYTVDDENCRIEIMAVGHRREVYRGT